MKEKCYDCGAKIITGGVTVGRTSSPTIWETICRKCDEDFKKTDGYKKVQRLVKSINKK